MSSEVFGRLTLRCVLRLVEVDGENEEGFIVRYEELDRLPKGAGLYVVKKGDQVIYCGKFTTGFITRWLYARGRYIYHAKRHGLARALQNQHKVFVFSEELPALLLQHPNCGLDLKGFERELYDHYHPEWNRTPP